MAIKVNVKNEIRVPRKVKELSKNSIITCLTYLGVDNVIVTLILTSDEIIASINENYRKKSGPTDVISFAYRDTYWPIPTKYEYLGDIFISIETAQRQAESFKVTLIEELQRLIVHGVLHLLGYDHEKSTYKKRIMQKKEDEILLFLQQMA